MNPELSFALRLDNMLRLALVTALGALARTESRGAHYRTDYPLRNDREWLNRTLVRWSADAAEPDFSYEPVGLLDLPPGSRGYGSDERIEMQASIAEYNADVLERPGQEWPAADKRTAGQQSTLGRMGGSAMKSGEPEAMRRLRFDIFRYNPEDPDSVPHMQSFELDETPYMTLYHRPAPDPGDAGPQPAVRFCVPVRRVRLLRHDGQRAPHARLPKLDRGPARTEIRLHPLPVFKLVGDLSVDTGNWFREMVDKTEAWVRAKHGFDAAATEERMDDDLAPGDLRR